MHSLVGIGGVDDPSRYPLRFGNYFALRMDGDPMNGLRVANFWAENLTEAAKRFLPDGMVSVLVWSWSHPVKGKEYNYDISIIDDPRIPDDWYNNKMCWTGGWRPPLEIAQQMYAVRGDATNELEEWTDPVNYYAKRGGVYEPGTGIVRYTIKQGPARPLNVKWETKEMLSHVIANPRAVK